MSLTVSHIDTYDINFHFHVLEKHECLPMAAHTLHPLATMNELKIKIHVLFESEYIYIYLCCSCDNNALNHE